MKFKKINNGLYIYNFFDYYPQIVNKKNFISFLIKDIKNSDIGFAGFKTKKKLNQFLENEIFAQEKEMKIIKYKVNEKEVTKIIKNSMRLCQKEIKTESIKFFIFPSFHPFIKNKMRGVSGFTPWKNTILLFINPTSGWKSALAETVAHEFNHLVMLKYHKWETLLDSLIFEGIAEHFREKVIGGKKAPWSLTLNKEDAKKLFSKIKRLLSSKSTKLYRSIFFENKGYPLWAGYSLGYQIIKSFLKKNPKLKWQKIIRLAPRQILEKSNFIKNTSVKK